MTTPGDELHGPAPGAEDPAHLPDEPVPNPGALGTEDEALLEGRMNEEVFYPWQEACMQQQHPWRATPELRRQWLHLAQSQSRLDREIGVVALCRCSQLQQDEQIAIAHFFDEGTNFSHLPAIPAVQLVLAGASPPPYLFAAYFSEATPNQLILHDPVAKMLLSMLTRHPANKWLSEEFANQQDILMHVAGATYGLNPLMSRPLLQRLLDSTNPWIRGSALANPAVPFDEAFALVKREQPLDFPAIGLRPDLTPAQWNRIADAHLLEDTFLFIMLEHPAAQGEEPPPVDWADPSIDAMRYFSDQNHLGALWRWWNPLLNPPWIQDSIESIPEPGPALAFLLFGAPSEFFDGSPILDDPLVRRLIQQHPDFVSRAYMSAKEQGKLNEIPTSGTRPPPPRR